MRRQIILALAICVFLTYGAPLEEEKEKNGRRQGKTLGLVTAGAQSIAPIVATAGKGVVGLLAGVSAILPLAKLGLAKYFLYKWLKNRKSSATPTIGINLGNAGNGYGFAANVGAADPSFYQAQTYLGPEYETSWIETPSSNTKASSDTVYWKRGGPKHTKK